ncbi:hypothetical protein SAMN05192574_107102 [Mucilaginibacter gossypiicola]|uniref:Chaperone of endosialidase n=1 Tax=Mucilaginibacter gossypiicola TaxID=551995 RepID=A0A1H8NUL4_9SPHI|nr:hypothetical protein [Mucilaginibacter gossypiicola]SEO33289.1 hypothetical protein SAMN05192574_107102 [Mucilaginibacter gossypiicola]
MYRILFSTLILVGIFKSVNAQSINDDNNSGSSSSLKNASFIINKLNPLSVETTFQGSAPYYKFGLDLSSTRAVMPDVIRTGSNWSAQGKSTQKAVNFETIDYTQLVPVLVAAMQEQQAQITELKKQIADLKKETASR